MRLSSVRPSLWSIAGGLACAALLATNIQAKVNEVISRGDWGLFAGKDVSNTDVCVAATSGTEIYMGVKVYAHQDHITIHFAKKGWSIPSGTKARIAFQFDRSPPWTGTGYSVDNAQVLETVIPLKSIDAFSREFKGSQRLTVVFPDGSEAPWNITLRGSRFIMNAFYECVTVLARNNGPGSQPYAPPTGPSQPFQKQAPESPAQPTQPTPPPDENTKEPEPPVGTRI